MTCKSTRFFLLIAGMLIIPTQHGMAKPLSSEDCAKLVSEHSDLAKKDIEAMMDQDPAIASTSMSPEQLAEIERFLFIEGEIRFRCPEIKLAVPKPPAPEPTPEEAKTASEKTQQPEQPAGPPVPLPQRKPKPSSKRAG